MDLIRLLLTIFLPTELLAIHLSSENARGPVARPVDPEEKTKAEACVSRLANVSPAPIAPRSSILHCSRIQLILFPGHLARNVCLRYWKERKD